MVLSRDMKGVWHAPQKGGVVSGVSQIVAQSGGVKAFGLNWDGWGCNSAEGSSPLEGRLCSSGCKGIPMKCVKIAKVRNTKVKGGRRAIFSGS